MYLHGACKKLITDGKPPAGLEPADVGGDRGRLTKSVRAEALSFATPLPVLDPGLKKRRSTIELSSLWGTGSSDRKYLKEMAHPGKHWA